MANVKVSELEKATTVGDNDIFLMSQKNGTSFNSKSITGSALKSSVGSNVTFNTIYPVGSIFTTVNASFNPQSSFGGTWTKIAEGKCLFGATASQTPGNTINQGLPKPSVSISSLTCSENGAHTHTVSSPGSESSGDGTVKRCSPYSSVTKTTTENGNHTHTISGNITISDDEIYGKSTIVQPPAIAVIFWQRTA